ncbi:MAG TPA: tyrosine-type recombinase/integrase [Acidimicrobiales bacterium]|nr:tyrosine-type recombinase/integrase [Acidimicrobiales bacterium]
MAEAVDVYVADRFDRGEVGGNSAKQFRVRLGTLVVACPPDLVTVALDRESVRCWQATVGHLAPATRRAYLSTVRTFCRWCVDVGLMEADPTVGFARVRELRRGSRALSSAQVRRLVLVLPDDRARLIVGLLHGLGLRCCEAARLCSADYDPVELEVKVTGKGSDERTLPVPPGVARMLDEAIAAGCSPVVGLSAGRISALVSGWMRQAGIKAGAWDRVSAHALRHTFASDMLDRCGNVRTVQEALGHVNLATTDRYLRRASVEQIRAGLGDDDYGDAA